MKKILGVSFAAMLAVTPMMASADDLPTITLLGNPAGTVAAEANVATTSYVKGAYNDLAGKINTDRGAINTLNGSVSTEGSVLKTVKDNAATGTYNANGEYASGTIGAAIQGAVSANTSAIQALDATVSQTAGADGLALQVVEQDGIITSVTGSIAENTYDAYGAATSAVQALDATVTQTAGADGLALQVVEQDGVITGVTGSIAENTYDAYGAASTAEQNAKDYADGLVTNQATKEGVVATINNSTASGNVTVYTTWGDETTTGQDTITVSSTVTAPATNAYYATLGAQSGTTQTDSTPAPSPNPGV